jgi:hypothetical protein
MLRGRIALGGVKKDPLCHCYQRGRKLISNRNKNISKRKRLPSIPNGENVGHSGMIFSLMETGAQESSINPKFKRNNLVH